MISDRLHTVISTLPSGVTLVAVSKYYPAQAVTEAYNQGQRLFGESRVQELMAKYNALPKDIEWQMIGHLQTNKVKYIAPFISLIQSVDSARLLETINREAEKCGRTIDCLLEVHVAKEDTKSGWEESELREYLETGAISNLQNIRIRGIMGMATNTLDNTVVRADFEKLAALKTEFAKYFDSSFDTLSMGMSEDYPIAIECGATMVRVGSKIFGGEL